MDGILTDIAFALARAAVATLLSRELYSFTVPGLILFSFTVYTVITRDLLRDSLPPYMGLTSVWAVLSGEGRRKGEKNEVVRLSVFGKDVFWVGKREVMKGLVGSGEALPLYPGRGIVFPVGERERKAIEKVRRRGAVGLT